MCLLVTELSGTIGVALVYAALIDRALIDLAWKARPFKAQQRAFRRLTI